MSLPETVSRYVDARLAADAAPVWARLSSEDEAAHRMRELLAACFGASVALDDALIAHAPDFVRAQAQRWRGMVGLLAPVKKPKPIVVLGPWQQRSTGAWFRLHIRSHYDGAYVFEGEYQIRGGGGVLIHSAQGGKDEADAEMRKRGWVLLDAEPHTQPVALDPWQDAVDGGRYRGCRRGSDRWCAVGVGPKGWCVEVIPLRLYGCHAAHGPQTGPEGERLAMAAALALGFVEGT